MRSTSKRTQQQEHIRMVVKEMSKIIPSNPLEAGPRKCLMCSESAYMSENYCMEHIAERRAANRELVAATSNVPRKYNRRPIFPGGYQPSGTS